MDQIIPPSKWIRIKQPLLPLRYQYATKPTFSAITGKKGRDLTLSEAIRRGWSTFTPHSSDLGIDAIICKKMAKIQLQIKTHIKTIDERYGLKLVEFTVDPDFFFVYCLIYQYYMVQKTDWVGSIINEEMKSEGHHFFIIPSTEMHLIPRFRKAFKTKTFREKGAYKANMTIEQIERQLGKYKDEKGWKLLEARALLCSKTC